MADGLIFFDFVRVARDVGLFEFYLPFLLMFSTFYGLLTKAGIFGKPEDKVPRTLNAIISLVAALYILNYTPFGVTIGQFLTAFFGQSLLAFVTLITAILVITILNVVTKGGSITAGAKYTGVLAVIIIIFIFLNSSGLSVFGITQAPGLIASQDILVLVLIIVTVAIIIWLTQGKSRAEVIGERAIEEERRRGGG